MAFMKLTSKSICPIDAAFLQARESNAARRGNVDMPTDSKRVCKHNDDKDLHWVESTPCLPVVKAFGASDPHECLK